MSTANLMHSFRFRLLKLICAARRLLLSPSVVYIGQVFLVLLPLVLLAYLVEWLVSALLHLPMIITFVATVIFMGPAFFICWWLLRMISRQSGNNIHFR